MAKELGTILDESDNVEISDDGTNIRHRVRGSGWTAIVALTQDEYDNLSGGPDANTLYFIVENPNFPAM